MNSRISLLLGALCLALLPGACKSASSEGKPPGEDEPAGKVIKLEGTVHVQNKTGERRPLAEGDEVRGADTIETGAASLVTIHLYHNDVEWNLGADMQSKVSASLAWRAPRRSGGPLLTDRRDRDVTAPAGRHANREAADSPATALAPGPVTAQEKATKSKPVPRKAEGRESKLEESGGPEMDIDVPSDTGSDIPDMPAQADPSPPGRGGNEGYKADGVAAPGNEAYEGDDEGDDKRADDGGGGATGARQPATPKTATVAKARAFQATGKFAGRKSGGGASPAIELGRAGTEGKSDAKAIAAVVSRRLERVVRCLGKSRPAPGATVKVAISVDRRGRVQRVVVTGKQRGFADCAKKAIDSKSFAGATYGGAGKVTVPLTWRGR